jgi:two-component system, OmpR family, response regulator
LEAGALSGRSGTCATLPGMRVLVVEDEVRLAEAIRHGLEQEGLAVDVANDGSEGLWLATENAYDAIVLDLMLPGRNGFQVCSELRAAEIWTPILMLTAKSGDLDHAEALDTGADDFLAKPFSFVVLLAHLRALMRRGTRERPTVLTAGDLRLDPAQHRCWRDDTEIELTPRQFSLLEYLMSRAGEVLSKTEIVEHVWDFAFDGDLNIVEVYVGYLRKKIDVPFNRNAIQTIRLVGYRLDPDGG